MTKSILFTIGIALFSYVTMIGQNVGIGTVTPTSKLHLKSSIIQDTFVDNFNDGTVDPAYHNNNLDWIASTQDPNEGAYCAKLPFNMSSGQAASMKIPVPVEVDKKVHISFAMKNLDNQGDLICKFYSYLIAEDMLYGADWQIKNYSFVATTPTIFLEFFAVASNTSELTPIFIDNIIVTYETGHTLKIEDGTQGEGFLLQSDQLGQASWVDYPSILDSSIADAYQNLAWDHTSGALSIENGDTVYVSKLKGSDGFWGVAGDTLISSPQAHIYIPDDPMLVGDYIFHYDGFEGSLNFGNENQAGIHAFACGKLNTASGIESAAWGHGNTASGLRSAAWGYSNIASGATSAAWGTMNYTAGTNSVAWGSNNEATHTQSTVWGYNNMASGWRSTSWGENNTADSKNATSWGESNSATAELSTTYGKSNEASGLRSSAWGIYNIATADDATAWGYNNKATFNRSTAWGQNNHASSLISTAWGSYNESSALLTTVWGGNNRADGSYSTIWGKGNIANSYAETNFGRYCDTLVTASAMSWDNDDILLSIGNGTSETNRHNALTVRKNGNVGIGLLIPSYRLQLETNSAAKPSSSSWTVASDERLKKDVIPFIDGLDIIQAIDPVWFTYTGEAEMPEETAVGTLAQQLEEVAPYMVKDWEYRDRAGNTTTYKAVDYGAMDFVLINAVKELKSQIEELNAIVNNQADLISKLQMEQAKSEKN